MKLRTALLAYIFILPYCIHAQYYNGALGLNGNPLKISLHNIIDNHNYQGWPLWSFFSSTDAINTDTVFDIYSAIPGGTAPYSYQFVVNQCGTYNGEGDCFNHEHSWPSTYFNDALPMRTDLHHVFPTDGYVNNKRSNYPYGNVTNSTWTSQNGSKLGTTNSYSGYTDKAFEPIDSFKGDVARAYFYMSTRYLYEDASWGNWVMASGALLSNDAITLLLDWHHSDPVSQKEIDRNNAVYSIQGNRNPFIDYPQFADCIWGTANCTSLGVKEWTWQKDIQIYPNPCSDIFQIQNMKSVEINSASVYNIMGQKLMQVNAKINTIDVSRITEGTYYVVLETEKGNWRQILVKD